MKSNDICEMETQTHYGWRIGHEGRYLIPWSDPQVYEFPFDFTYASPEEAIAGLEDSDASDVARDEGWLLVEVTIRPMIQMTYRPNGTKD